MNTDEHILTVVILTFNSMSVIEKLMKSLYKQEGIEYNVLVVDSGSTDGTLEYLAKNNNISLICIENRLFDHGGTRNHALSSVNTKYTVFLTHDVVFDDKQSLLSLFKAIQHDGNIKAAYGRQKVDNRADYYSRLLREFNYPQNSRLQTKDKIEELGIKTIFLSNSYSIYETSYVKSLGGFPENTIFGEDMILASNIINDGKSIKYEASSEVVHYHSYSLKEEFKRSFDIGVMHYNFADQLKMFNNSAQTGLQFLQYQFTWIIKENQYLRIPDFICRTGAKAFGYAFGKRVNRIPRRVSIIFSMNKGFFQ